MTTQIDPGFILHLAMLVSIPSLIGCLLNILLMVLLKRYRDSLGKLILMIAIMDLIFTISVIYQEFRVATSSTECYVFFFFQNTAFLGTAFSTCCFAHGLLTILRFRSFNSIDTIVWKYIMATLILSSLLGIISLFCTTLNLYQGEKCWDFPEEMNEHEMDFFSFDLPCFLAAVYCVVYFIKSMRELRKTGGGVHWELTAYPIILSACILPRSLLDFYLMFDPVSPTWWFYTAQIMWSAQGFLNALVYGLTLRIVNLCKKLCDKSPTQRTQSLVYRGESLLSMQKTRSDFSRLSLVGHEGTL